MSRMLKIAEVAMISGTCPTTIRRLIGKGSLKAIKIGSHWRISEEDLHNFLKTTPTPEDKA
jgi:excisionase family DNA binding protein